MLDEEVTRCSGYLGGTRHTPLLGTVPPKTVEKQQGSFQARRINEKGLVPTLPTLEGAERGLPRVCVWGSGEPPPECVCPPPPNIPLPKERATEARPLCAPPCAHRRGGEKKRRAGGVGGEERKGKEGGGKKGGGGGRKDYKARHAPAVLHGSPGCRMLVVPLTAEQKRSRGPRR